MIKDAEIQGSKGNFDNAGLQKDWTANWSTEVFDFR